MHLSCYYFSKPCIQKRIRFLIHTALVATPYHNHNLQYMLVLRGIIRELQWAHLTPLSSNPVLIVLNKRIYQHFKSAKAIKLAEHPILKVTREHCFKTLTINPVPSTTTRKCKLLSYAHSHAQFHRPCKITNALEYEFDPETSRGSCLLISHYYYTVSKNLFQNGKLSFYRLQLCYLRSGEVLTVLQCSTFQELVLPLDSFLTPLSPLIIWLVRTSLFKLVLCTPVTW